MVSLGVILTKRQYKEVSKLARKKEVSKSEIIRKCINESIDKI